MKRGREAILGLDVARFPSQPSKADTINGLKPISGVAWSNEDPYAELCQLQDQIGIQIFRSMDEAIVHVENGIEARILFIPLLYEVGHHPLPQNFVE